jgi:hypothetical protein
MKITQTEIIIPDCTFYLYDTSISTNVQFEVSKGGDPDKLIILEAEIRVFENGTLEDYWTTSRQITGSFYNGDSLQIMQGVGKTEGHREYWNGKK